MRSQAGLRQWLPNLDVGLVTAIHGESSNGKMNPEISSLVGNVEGADVIIVDDIIDTGRTLASLTAKLKQQGARKVYCFASHALFNGNAQEVIDNAALEQVVVMNTVPSRDAKESQKIKRLSVGPMLAELIQAEHFKVTSYIDFDTSERRKD